MNKPPRIQGVIARKAPVAVLFRRGPAKWVQQIRWNMETDEMTAGQWLKGRVYAERSDLSWDGRYLVYAALDGKWASPSGGAYTAVSQPPYFTALALWAEGSTYGLDGVWMAKKELHLAISSITPSIGSVPSWLSVKKSYIDRRHKARSQGWQSDVPTVLGITPYVGRETRMWKPWNGTRLMTHFGGQDYPYRRAPHYWLETRSDPLIEEALWADIDPRGRLVFAAHGKVFVRDIGCAPVEIADLNANIFEPVDAPLWATRWN